MLEEWKDIPGWEGCYRISNLGNLWSCQRDRLMKSSPNKATGYVIRTLYDGKTNRKCGTSIHYLVMLAFVGDRPSPKHEINHIDGNKANNILSNLEYCTSQENSDHAWKTGLITKEIIRESSDSPDWHLRKPGDDHPKTKWSDSLKEEIRTKYTSGKSFTELRKDYPEIPKCTLWSFISGRRK